MDDSGNTLLISTINKGDHVTSFPTIVPTKAGYVLDGWTLGEDSHEKIDFDTFILNEDVVVYPYWVAE